MRADANTFQICFAADDNYAMPLAVTIASILDNNRDADINIYVVDGNISPENKEKLYALNSIKEYNLEFLQIEYEQFANIELTTDYITITAYFRYILPALLPVLKKVLYLDCDTIVCGSLQELWNTDIDGFLLAGVADVQSLECARRIGSSDSELYVNTGVLLINLDGWRENRVTNDLFKYTFENSNRMYEDQDVINAVCRGKIKIVDDKWNYQYAEYEIRRGAYKDYLFVYPIKPVIVHFIGRRKPWHKGRNKAKYLEAFWHYYNMTPYRGDYTTVTKLRIMRDRIRYTFKLFFKKILYKVTVQRQNKAQE